MLNLVRVSVLAGRGRAWLIRRIITLVGPGRAEGYSATGGRMRLVCMLPGKPRGNPARKRGLRM